MTARRRLRAQASPALTLFDQVFGPSWSAWRGVLCGLFGLPMTDSEAATFRARSGRSKLPTAPARELWAVVGRRAGKSRIAAFLAVVLAAFKTYKLAPGERAVVLMIATDRK